MVTQEQVGERLARLRKQAGLTQAEVAEKLHLSDETLSRLERGKQWTDFGVLVRLASLYKVGFADLFAVHPKDGHGKDGALQEVIDLLRPRTIAELNLVRDVVRVLFRVK